MALSFSMYYPSLFIPASSSDAKTVAKHGGFCRPFFCLYLRLDRWLLLLLLISPVTSFYTGRISSCRCSSSPQRPILRHIHNEPYKPPCFATVYASEEETRIHKGGGPLSMDVDHLANALDGTGRALLAWDCFRIGMDPSLFFDSAVPDELLDFSVNSLLTSDYIINATNTNTPPTTSRQDIRSYMPLRRISQTLGSKTLLQLSALYSSSSSFSCHDSSSIEHALATLQHIQISSDGTTKLLIRFASDGALVESVIIPVFPMDTTSMTADTHGKISSATPRSTLCVSSQVGCRQACTFCATGRMGKLRDLSTDEILIQLYFANKVVRVFQTLLAKEQQVVSLPPLPHVDNVVFMGMGDASDNALAVLEATSIMTHQRLFGLAQSKVTISTVAPSPQAFLQLGQAPAILAWSVHAVRDSLRKQLVPTTQYTMVELRQGLIQALLQRPTKLQTTMWQITLIDQVNDSPIEAEELANFALEMMESVPRIKLILNLIPFNDIGHAKYRKPSIERIRHFQKILMERGLVSFIRTTRGDDESAACGQLATKKPKLSSPLP